MKIFEKINNENFKIKEDVETVKSIADVKKDLDREQSYKRTLILEHNKRLAESNARIAALQNTIDQAKLVGVEVTSIAEQVI